MDLEKLSIRELLKLCLDTDDGDAWHEFQKKIQKLASAVIKRTLDKTAAPDTVDDLIQNTWVKLLENDRAALRRIRGEHENSIFAYVRVAAYSVAQDHIRRLRPVVCIDDPGFIEPPNQRWTSAFASATRDEVDRALKSMVGKQNFSRDYAIFWLYYEQGYSVREIAGLPSLKREKNSMGEKGVDAVIQRLKNEIRRILGTDETSTSAGT